MTPNYQWKQMIQKSLINIIGTYIRSCKEIIYFRFLARSLLCRLFLLSPLFRLKSIKRNVYDILKRFNFKTLNWPQLYWQCNIVHFHQGNLQFLKRSGTWTYFFQLFGWCKVIFLSQDEVSSPPNVHLSLPFS